MSLTSIIQEFDYGLFSKINGQWHTNFLDQLFLLIREAALWIPFYIFLLVFVTINFKRNGWLWAGTLAATVIFSNFFSSNIIKDNIFRLRPCHDPALIDNIRILANYCPVSSSFTSSHATNHFAISMFMFLTFKDIFGNWVSVIFLWAALISYAQVYVGVHFPTDVLAGAIAGTIIGYLAGRFFNSEIELKANGYLFNT